MSDKTRIEAPMTDLDLHAVAERYHAALDAKPSKGDYTPAGIMAITDSVADVPQLLAEIERMSGKHNLVRLAYQMAESENSELTGAEIAESFRVMLDDHWRQRAKTAEAEVARLKAQNIHYAQRIANASSSMQELLDVALADTKTRIEALLDRLLRLTMASDDGTPYEHNGHPEGDGEPDCPACWAASILAAIAGPADG